MKKIIILSALLILINQLFSQKNTFTNSPDATLFKSVESHGWVNFIDNLPDNPEQVFNHRASSFGLTEGYSMRLVKKREGESGYIHYRFKQHYNNIIVEQGDFSVHAQNGKLISGNGSIYTSHVVKSSIVVPEAAALQMCLRNINAKQYHWQSTQRQQRLRLKKNDPNATYYPKAEMVYVFDPISNLLKIAYKFHILSPEATKSNTCYIDAGSGELLRKIPLEKSCDYAGVVTNWYGAKSIYTNDVAVVGNSYNLQDDCTGSVYGVYDIPTGGNIFNTPNNFWGTDRLRSAATSLWGVKQSYTHFKNFFGRNGHSHTDNDIDIYQGYYFTSNGGNNNAAYSYDPIGTDEIKVGIGNTDAVQDDYNALDIMAHEFTHGVTQYEADLDYEGESGALNESFSDVFGEWIEFKELGTHNWLIGWDRIVGGNHDILRSLINPLLYFQPDTYKGMEWRPTTGPCDTTNDNCGVHYNSGVQNQMFYFLSDGGSGWRTTATCHNLTGTGTPYAITGIGINKAITIAYKVLCDYLNSGSGYVVARNAWVQAASEIYGPCSFEAIQTGKAWGIVGIGPPNGNAPDNTYCGTYGATTYFNDKPGAIFLSVNNCVTSISTSGNQVRFSSASKVVMGPGFSSLSGSKFNAIINDCSYANY